MEYPKTENLYARDPETHVAGPEHGFRVPEVDLVSKWLVLEKVDGMNMRVIFEPAADDPIRILGRTDRANIPGDLLASIQEWATWENFSTAFEDEYGYGIGPSRVILFGEGYGAGIQSGGHYRPDKGFILFDVLVGDSWLSWANVKGVAEVLGIEHVPAFMEDASLDEAKALVADSHLTEGPVEGIVCRTDPYLFTGRGKRVMFKYKVRDLA